MNIDDLEGLDDATRKEVEELQKVTREEDGGDAFGKAYCSIGKIFREKNLPIEALKIFNKIEREDSPIWYADAQIEKGLTYYDLNQLEESYQAFDEVKESDGEFHYVMAQYGLGSLLIRDNDKNKALVSWRNIKGKGESLSVAKLKFKIGATLLKGDFSEYDEARQFFVETLKYYPYESYCYQKICGLLLDPKLKAIGKKSLQLLDKTLETVNILKLDFGTKSNENKSPERKLAHYTNTSITNLLLEKNEDGSLPSSFRLNTINNVNDPSEGHLLVNYLEGIRESYFYAPDFDKSLHAFISCFTFNHDSLNQFRLYGKEANKEASGVSLVFKKEFFQLDSSLGGLSFLSLGNNIQNSDKDFSPLETNEQSDKKKASEDKFRISRQPVMRCVYLDPVSGFAQLAQRNKLTFYREFGDENIGEESKAELEWLKYKNDIEKKERTFSKSFASLKAIYEELNKEKLKLDKVDLDAVEILLSEILLPLKYLIKHSAFQEEQKCRMVYVTSLDAPEVKIEHRKFLFVEYDAEVKENLNKIYIAPAATEYQLYLSWLLRDSNVKIELSNNPYRQT